MTAPYSAGNPFAPRRTYSADNPFAPHDPTDAQQATAAAVFAGASEQPQDYAIPSMADRFGLTDPIGTGKQFLASLPEQATMAARDVAGTVAALGTVGGAPLGLMAPGAGERALQAGQSVRERFTPALSEINTLAGGAPTTALGTAARMVGPLPLIAGGKALARGLSKKAPLAVEEAAAAVHPVEAPVVSPAELAPEGPRYRPENPFVEAPPISRETPPVAPEAPAPVEPTAASHERTIPATVGGKKYDIPEMWLVGATRDMSYRDALKHWHEQAQMEAAHTASRSGAGTLYSNPFADPAQVVRAFASKAGATVALGGLGAALSTSDNEDLQKTGHGILALAVLHGIGSRRIAAAGGKVGNSLVEGLRTSPAGRRIVDAVNPEALLNPEVKSALATYEQDVAKGVARGKELGGKARALGPQGDRTVSDIIEHESFEPPLPAAETERALAVAADIAQEFTASGRAKVAAGLLSPETVAAREGTYLPRKYARHEAGDIASGAPSGTSALGSKAIRIGRENMRKDLQPDVRTYLGEIREASYRTEQGLAKAGRDLAAAKLMQTLRAVPDVLHPDYLAATDALSAAHKAGDVVKVAEAERSLAEIGRRFGTPKGDYVRLPDARGLGPLRGAVVRREVANSLNGLPEIDNVGGTLLRYWKKVHTVYNPGTHIGNFFSNVSLAHLSGLSAWEQPVALAKAARELRTYGPAVKALTEAGVLDVNLATVTGEGAAQVGKTGATRLRELAATTRPATAKVLKAQGVEPIGPIERRLRGIDKSVGRLYNNEDNVFRVALYRKAVTPVKRGGLGMDQATATAYVRQNLINFRTRSPLLNWMRNYVSPFVLYPAKALPTVAKQIIDHPWRWITLAATWGSLDQYSQHKVGRIPDEDLPKGMTRGPAGYLMPGVVQLPFKGAEGEKYAMDVSRFTPLASVTTGGAPGSTGTAISPDIPASLQPSGPLTDLIARTALNTDPYTGEKTIRPTDTPGEIAKRLTIGDMDAGTFTPGALAGMTLPSALSFHGPRIINDLANANPKAAKTDALGLVGLRPRVVQAGEEPRRQRYQFELAMRQIVEEARRDLRKAKSDEARQAIMARAQEKRATLLARFRDQEAELAGAGR